MVELIVRSGSRSAAIGVTGMGYVGLTPGLVCSEARSSRVGFD
jgi:UDP-N-acetyl-D-mannosaminuronate dehydrogenase